MHRVTPASGLGWAVTEPASATVSLFDHDLLLVARVATSHADPLSVGATGRLLAVGDEEQVTVLDHHGVERWRRSWDRPVGGLGLDGDDILWVRLADPFELIAIVAASGEEIHRMALPGPVAAWFLHRPGDIRTGLALIEPDPSAAMLIGLDAGRIARRPLVGPDLAGFSPAGDRYLSMTLDGFLSVRDVTTDTVLAHRHLDDLPGTPPGLPRPRFADRAVFVTDGLMLVDVAAEGLPDGSDEHLVLAAGSLRCRSQVRYPHHDDPGTVHPAQIPGRWLTRDHEQGLLRLWQLDGRLDDEPLPGQIALL